MIEVIVVIFTTAADLALLALDINLPDNFEILNLAVGDDNVILCFFWRFFTRRRIQIGDIGTGIFFQLLDFLIEEFFFVALLLAKVVLVAVNQRQVAQRGR